MTTPFTRTRNIPQSEWKKYFNDVSKKLTASSVSVVVTGLDLGAQPEAEKLPLDGITYDDHDDAFEISAGALHHRISQPRAIFVQEDAGGALVACEVQDAEGHAQIVQLTPALALAAG